MIHHPELHTLLDTIRTHAGTIPDAPAIRISTGDVVSYGRLDRRSSALARALSSLGIDNGSRVAYLGLESVEYWELLFAAAKLGAVLVPVNFKLTGPEVEYILADSGAVAIVIDADHPLRGTTGITEIVRGPDYSGWRDETRSPLVEPAISPDTPIAQLYTSGTTGLPKGVVLAHRSFFAVLDSLSEHGLDWIDFQGDEVALIGIPGFHIGGLWFATQAFNAGVTVYSMPTFDPQTAGRLIRDGEVSTAIFVPAMMRSILDAGSPKSTRSRLRKTLYGGAPIAESLLQESTRAFGCEFVQIYGLTETGNTAICLPPDQHVAGSPRLRAAGRPYPCVEMKLVDADGNPVPTGEVGEVLLRTPAAMVEYWNLPEATASTMVDGWIRTGDAGLLDEEGYLYIQDRVKDMILVGGENVFPAEIENALVGHAKIADAAVVGIPDERSGEAVLAYVQTTVGERVSTRELALFLRSRLADFKLPTRYEFTDSIPRNPSGKILRRELRNPHWQGRDRQVN